MREICLHYYIWSYLVESSPVLAFSLSRNATLSERARPGPYYIWLYASAGVCLIPMTAYLGSGLIPRASCELLSFWPS